VDGRERLVRVDPTAAIAPERVENGAERHLTADAVQFSRWQQRTPWLADLRLRLDALRLFVARTDPALRSKLPGATPGVAAHSGADGQKVVLVLAACLTLGMTWLTWQVRRELKSSPAIPAARL